MPLSNQSKIFHCFNFPIAYVSHDEPEKEVEDSTDVEDATEEDATQETSAVANDLASEEIDECFQ